MPYPDGEIDIANKTGRESWVQRKLPAGVGFAVTQLIDDGFLDDCLQVIQMHLMDRARVLRGAGSRRPRG